MVCDTRLVRKKVDFKHLLHNILILSSLRGQTWHLLKKRCPAMFSSFPLFLPTWNSLGSLHSAQGFGKINNKLITQIFEKKFSCDSRYWSLTTKFIRAKKLLNSSVCCFEILHRKLTFRLLHQYQLR